VTDGAAAPLTAAHARRLRALADGADPRDPDGWAVRQGIGPLLAAAGEGGARLEPSRRRAEMAWQALAVHLERCLRAFDAAGIPSIVLKGAALALSHYAHPALRPMGDIDVLVAPARWDEAARLLGGLDWTVEDAAEHGAAFAGPGGVRLELHGALVSCPGLFPLRFDELFARSVPLGGGLDGRRLGDEDMVVHLALHVAFQHGFRARLGQYVDLARVAAGAPDGRPLLARASAAGARRPLAAALAVAERLLGFAPAPVVAGALCAHVPRAVRAWMDAIAPEPWRLVDGLPLARARWVLADGAVCRARLVAGTLWPGRPDGSREVSPWKALARGRRLLQQIQAR
jgi:hypothetical protein